MKIWSEKSKRHYEVKHPNERFVKYFDKADEKVCWPWKGGRDHDGYGIFFLNNSSIHASKYSWIFHIGKVPEGMYVLHTCDNPPCVNPNHLRLGTAKENSEDRDRKGRQCIGISHPRSKLTEEQVKEIRRLYIPRQVTLISLATQFGVSKKLILNIVRRRTWKHI